MTIVVDELAARLDDPALTVLDVRTADEYDGTRGNACDPRQGHLPGARNLDVGAIAQCETVEQVRELETAQIELAKLESRMRAVQQKLAYAGILRSQLAAGDNPKLTIFRDNAGRRESIEAVESSLLEPGDLVEVAIRTEFEAMEGTDAAHR